MIKLGVPMLPIYQSKYNFVYENRGGVIYIKSGSFGMGSVISIQDNATLSVGKCIHTTWNTKIIVAESVIIGDYCRIGWDTMIMDTSWHTVYNQITGSYSKKTFPIHIGNYNWIANGCQLMKNSRTPDFCIIGARSLLNKDLHAPSCSLIAGSPAKVVRENVLRDEFVKYYNGAKYNT